MGGLALGNLLALRWSRHLRSPLRCYAAVAAACAVSGATVVLLLPRLIPLCAPLFGPIAALPFAVNITRGFLAFIVLLVPSTAMGATFPLMVTALCSRTENFGWALGSLYGWNTLGAVAGVMLGELALFKGVGLTGSGLIAAALDLSAAGAALAIAARLDRSVGRESGPLRSTTLPVDLPPARWLIVAGLAGFIMLALEVIWFRVLLLFYRGHALNYAVILAVVLGGIALGSLCAAVWFNRDPEMQRHLALLAALNGILIIGLYLGFGPWANWLRRIDQHWRIVPAALFLIFPVSAVSGAMFAMTGKAIHGPGRSGLRSAATLSVANTVGGMLGSLFGGFVLIPAWGVEKSFMLASLGYAALLFVLPGWRSRRQRRRRLAASALYLAALSVFPFGWMQKRLLPLASAGFLQDSQPRVAFREGTTETIQLFRKELLGKPYSYQLVTNSHSMSNTALPTRRYMKLFGDLPSAVREQLRSALLVCYGLFSKATALTENPDLERIDIVDISRDVIDLSRVVYPGREDNPTLDARVKVQIEDGRFFLATRPQLYDLITAEPPPPHFTGIANLYTREYFALLRSRLAPGGVVSYWLPAYQLTEAETKAILKGFCAVFDNCSLWSGSGLEWIMLGIKEPVRPADEAAIAGQWRSAGAGPELRTLGLFSPQQLGSLFIADGERLQRWIGATSPLTDDFPRRLSWGISPDAAAVPGYRHFSDWRLSQQNFLQSGFIATIWPDSLRSASLPYFAVRDDVDALLAGSYDVVRYLDRCRTEPLLAPYLLWVLGSDGDAARILSGGPPSAPAAAGARRDYHLHAAALATAEGNLPAAESHLADLTAELGGDAPHREVYEVRMYLRASQHDFQGAAAIGREYVQAAGRGQAQRLVEVDGFLAWLSQRFR